MPRFFVEVRCKQTKEIDRKQRKEREKLLSAAMEHMKTETNQIAGAEQRAGGLRMIKTN